MISPDVIQSSIKFSAQRNGGQGDIKISIGEIDTDFVHGDIVKVYANDTTNRLIYTGYVDNIDETVNQGEDMEVSCIGLGSYLKNIIFTSGGVRTFTLNDTASNIITAIATYANSINPIITLGTITATVGNISQSFTNNNCFDALYNVTNGTPGYYFYVDETGAINFKADSVTPDYYITFQKDLQSYDESNLGKIFNTVYFTYNGGSKTYTDATSITTYGIREITMDDQNINNVTTADLKITKYLAKNAYPQENRELIVNREFVEYKSEILIWDNATITWDSLTLSWDNTVSTNSYGFEIIKPGEQIKILNFKKVVI